MGEIRRDDAKNRVYIKLIGFYSGDEAKKVADEFIGEMKKLKPGFDIVNDITEFKTSPPEATTAIARAQEMALELKAGRIVRIIGGQPTGRLQFERIGRKTGTMVANVSSIEEAEQILEEK